jgi:hypothetical protein
MFFICMFVIPVDVNKTCVLNIDNQNASLIVDKDINNFVNRESINGCHVTIDHNQYYTKWYDTESIGEYYEYKLYSDVQWPLMTGQHLVNADFGVCEIIEYIICFGI